MNYIVIGGPDKLSISACLKFLIKIFPKLILFEMHSLMSKEAVSLFIKGITDKTDEGIISYYAKGMINKNPESCIPLELKNIASVIIWFDLYSMTMNLVKDDKNFINDIKPQWDMHIKKLEALKR